MTLEILVFFMVLLFLYKESSVKKKTAIKLKSLDMIILDFLGKC